MLRPTADLVRWCQRVFGQDVTERVFAPLVADWAHDVDEPATAPARARAQLRWAAAFARTATEVSAACMARGATTVAPAVAARAHDARTVRHGLAAVTVALSAVLFLGTGWAVPTANRSWQHSVAATVGRAVPPPGLRELSLVQLVAAAPSAPTDAVQREIRGRVLIPMLWPAAMAFLGWRLGRRMKGPSLAGAFVAWFVGAATIAVFAYAPLAGFVFEDVDVICASLWLAGGLALPSRGATGGTRDAASC